MAVYNPALVERILRNYVDIRDSFEGRAQKIHDSSLVIKQKIAYPEKPLGAGNRPFPFMERSHASTPLDGKRRARSMEDLLCQVIDVEDALAQIYATITQGETETIRIQAKEDYFFLINYYILHLYTLDELMELRGVTSRGSMQRRAFSSIKRLTQIMEGTNDRTQSNGKRVFRPTKERKPREV